MDLGAFAAVAAGTLFAADKSAPHLSCAEAFHGIVHASGMCVLLSILGAEDLEGFHPFEWRGLLGFLCSALSGLR